MGFHPGEGTLPCAGDGTRPCGNHEVEGLEYCLHHMPDDLIEEAEEITGMRRCRQGPAGPYSCRYYAVKGTEPPTCKNHGANLGSAGSKHAARRVVESRAAGRLTVILAEYGEALLDPPPVTDPLSELLDLAAEIKAFKEIMRIVTAHLYSEQRIRTAHGRVGEQLRSEVLLYERATERLGALLLNIAKLNIEARLAKISETRVATMERALTAALAATGLELDGQEKARVVLLRELNRAA